MVLSDAAPNFPEQVLHEAMLFDHLTLFEDYMKSYMRSSFTRCE